MAYNTSFPMVPQNGIPFHLAEMILLGESGGEKKSRLSAEQCPAAVQRHRMRGNTGRGMFPCPRGTKASKRGHSGSCSRRHEAGES